VNQPSPGKVRKNLKSIAKTRPVDIKVGKRGITRSVLLEIRKPLRKDGMVKVSLNSDKQTRIEQAKTLQDELEAELISIVGKTASFVKDL
jgi:RNA-binding protein YhbY